MQQTRSNSRALATTVMLTGLVITGLVLPAGGTVDIFATAAIWVGMTLAISTGIEAIDGVRNLIRVDLLMLWALYGLTLLEFLFPQSNVGAAVAADAATEGTYAVLLGFAGLVIGRHLVPYRSRWK